MKKEDIHFSDWQRMFIGDVPAAFYWEVVLRIAIIYIILMVSMRLMGKRMASQLSRNEMIAMVSLAAAIGVPLQSPDRGILAAVVIAMVVVSIQQLTAWIATKNQVMESVTQGNLTLLVADGCIKLDNMGKTGVTRERVFAQLRSKGIRHLGQVKRLYFEAGGTFTVIKTDGASKGLCVLPDYDADYRARVSPPADQQVCQSCGDNIAANSNICRSCGSYEIVRAVR